MSSLWGKSFTVSDNLLGPFDSVMGSRHFRYSQKQLLRQQLFELSRGGVE